MSNKKSDNIDKQTETDSSEDEEELISLSSKELQSETDPKSDHDQKSVKVEPTTKKSTRYIFTEERSSQTEKLRSSIKSGDSRPLKHVRFNIDGDSEAGPSGLQCPLTIEHFEAPVDAETQATASPLMTVERVSENTQSILDHDSEPSTSSESGTELDSSGQFRKDCIKRTLRKLKNKKSRQKQSNTHQVQKDDRDKSNENHKNNNSKDTM